MSGTDSEYRELYNAITHLERKLTDALNTGLQTLQLAMQTLAEAHAQARLEQERRNAGFVSTARLDDVIRTIDVHTAEMAARNENIKAIQQQNARQEAALATLQARIEAQGDGFLHDVNGYLVSALMFGGGAVLSFILSHLVH